MILTLILDLSLEQIMQKELKVAWPERTFKVTATAVQLDVTNN